MKTLRERFNETFPESDYFSRHSRLYFEGADEKVLAFIESELTLATREVKREIAEKIRALKTPAEKMRHDIVNGACTFDNCDFERNRAIDKILLLSTLDTGEKQKCEECGKADGTVSYRTCGYSEEISGTPGWHTVCDSCEASHCDDI